MLCISKTSSVALGGRLATDETKQTATEREREKGMGERERRVQGSMKETAM